MNYSTVNMEGCVITDSLEVTDKKAFLSYLRKNKINKERFILETFHKSDLYTGEPLIFKNEDQYFINDFNSRDNLVNYLIGHNDSYKYCLNFFLRRKKRKNLIYFPSECELKTFISPSIRLMQKLDINLDQLFKESGLRNKFDYSIKKINPNEGKLNIVQDNREQKPLKFKSKSEVSKLDFGDYSALGDFYSNIYIERKSLSDFLGTLSQGFERFKNEIKRAADLNSYLIVVIECPLTKALKFNELSYLFSKVTPDFIFHRLREIMQDNDHIQFLFTRDREESSRVIEKIFRAKEQVKTFDLQHAYESGVL